MPESGKSEIGFSNGDPHPVLRVVLSSICFILRADSQPQTMRAGEGEILPSLSKRVCAEKATFLNCSSLGEGEIFFRELREESFWLLAQTSKSFGC